MKKKLIIVIMAAFLVCGCGKVSKLSDGSDAVVSFENGEKISVDTLYDEMKERYAIGILIDMIDEHILSSEYENKLEDAKKYADDTVKSLLTNYKSEEELLSAISSYYGYNSIEEFKEYIKLNYLRDLVTTDYAKSKITEKEIETYYEDEVVGDIEASHILITADVTEDMSDDDKKKAEETALNTAKDIIKKLDSGAKFADLAKEYSKDDSNKDNGGELGSFNKGEMEISFEDAAYKLKVNEYTKTPVKTSYGYHVILKTKEHDKKSFDDVKEEIIETLSKELISKDATISITALTELRKEKGMDIEDDSLQSNYNKYINQLYNYYTTSTN